MNNQILLYNLEAEEVVLGALLMDPNAISHISLFLQPDDFYKEKHRGTGTCFRTITRYVRSCTLICKHSRLLPLPWKLGQQLEIILKLYLKFRHRTWRCARLGIFKMAAVTMETAKKVK